MNGSQAIVKENDRMITVHFDSILDLLEHQETGKNAERFAGFMSRRKPNYKRNEWFGTTNKNVGDVIDHALTGDKVLYDSLAEKVRRMDKTLGTAQTDYVQKIKSVRRRLVHDRIGDEIDIHKVYAGQLDTAWSRRERIEVDKEHRLITLFINIAGLADVKAKDSLWRAVVALKVFQDLERAGKSVKIIAGGVSVGTFKADNRLCTCGIVIKDYNQSLSLERLAAMSHVGFYRVFGFAAKAAQSIRNLRNGMGSTTVMSDDRVPINLQEEINKGHTRLVYIGKSTTEHQAISDLRNVYKQLKDLSNGD